MLTYGDLRTGRIIENPESGEAGEIESLGNGLIDVCMTKGHNVGHTFTFEPQEILDQWQPTH
jgi:hypothetical protein